MASLQHHRRGSRGPHRRGRRPRSVADAGARRHASRGHRRNELLVDRDPRAWPPGAGRGAESPAGCDESRHVRRADPRTRRAAGAAAGGDHPDRFGDGFLQRLRLGVGGGRGEDGAAVLAQPRQARETPADDLAGRLPRRHLHADEHLRPRRRHALAVDRRPGPPGVRAAGAPRLRAGLQRRVRGTAGAARLGVGRRGRGARGAGRGRDALPRSAIPE